MPSAVSADGVRHPVPVLHRKPYRGYHTGSICPVHDHDFRWWQNRLVLRRRRCSDLPPTAVLHVHVLKYNFTVQLSSTFLILRANRWPVVALVERQNCKRSNRLRISYGRPAGFHSIPCRNMKYRPNHRCFGRYLLDPGTMFLLSAVLWPLLPILSPAHISGALMVVINLR